MVDVVGGFLVGVAALLLVLFVRFVFAYAQVRNRDDALSRAVARTGQWTLALVVGLGGTVAVGLVQFADIFGATFGFVAAHPYFASNFAILGIGAGGLSGLFTISGQEYIGIGLMVVGAVFLSVEVDDAI